ncbi:MAG TPA: Hsp20 family protein [Burkholderiaceae bacterium]
MTRLSLYDPFAEVFPELFRGTFAVPRVPNGEALEIKVDVSETPGEFMVHAELPGVSKDDIHVEIDGNRVSITGEVKKETEKKDGERLLRSERYYGSVARSFALATEIDEAKSIAKFENGVLNLTLKKKEVVGGKKLQIA